MLRSTAWSSKRWPAPTSKNVDELRELELARLDALQSAHWDRACAGDVASAFVILKIIDRRARVLGLSGHVHLHHDEEDVTVLW